MSQMVYAGSEADLKDVLKEAEDGSEVIIERKDGRRFKLVLMDEPKPKRTFGSARGSLKMLDGFDDPLDEFEEYT